ncbi:protein ALP1-like [Magnolia sinica]|uniref:protein ALP1-like n=1 Tax=Magnolia sinica TaxID=86752 RepID=UPI0026594ACA|nr:protein ALP1-like [Magnolia sinica]
MDSSDEDEMKRVIMSQAVSAYVQAVGEYCHYYMFKQPARHGDDERAKFINSIIWASDGDCLDQLRMNRDSFFELCTLIREKTRLRDTRDVSLEEQVVIFLHTLGHNVRNRVLGHRFIRSEETVSRHFHRVLTAIVSLYPDLVKSAGTETPLEIQANLNWSAYFQDCLGAIDGTHIPAHVLAVDQASFRNRKGVLSQNVLAACSFDMKFTYVLAGWEGSASDARVLHNAMTRSDDPLIVPNGKYYVVDAGYAHSPGFMAPYRGVRYHLQKYRTGRAPANIKELFNYRHAQLRNAIERCFGVLKDRFPILKSAMQYEFQTQVQIVIACCVLHNYIRTENESRLDSDFVGISAADGVAIPTPVEVSTNDSVNGPFE